MRLLVTGGAGYIGSVVTALLLREGHRVTVLDDLSTGHRDAVAPGAELVEADLADAARVLGPDHDAVLHFAAKSLVSESTRDPEAYWRTNAAGTLAVLSAMRAHGVRRLVVSSTAAVYGEPDEQPITEDTPPRPANPYGASKLAADHMAASFAGAHGIAAASLRYFNVAGAQDGLGERHDPETHLVPALLRVAAGRESAARVHGTDYPTRDGSAVRDYLHVGDLALAHVRALEALRPGRHRVFNLGTGRGATVLEVLAAVREATGHPLPAEHGPRRAGDPAVLVAGNDRARTELGWAPRRDLAAIVADAWEFARGPGAVGR